MFNEPQWNALLEVCGRNAMSLPKSPFSASTSVPGEGVIELSLLPPRKQVLTTLTYQYPLKLIAPDPHEAPNEAQHPVTVVFLLTYGGGLVGGDKINLHVQLADQTNLVLVTQGSTKIYKSPSRDVVSGQTLNVTFGKEAALCYLPDPTQPFGESVYEQRQTFHLDSKAGSSLCVLDWVTEGRKARGESWTLHSWKGRNEVRERVPGGDGKGRLLVRDTVMLSDDPLAGQEQGLLEKTNGMGVFGTLILFGPVFKALAGHFLREFSSQPRIGGKNWSSEANETNKTPEESHRERRRHQEQAAGLLWTAANVRGFVLVKFGAIEADGARKWLGEMLRHEGSVEKEFGHQALFCLR
jgi:urease accessory protein